MLSASLNKSSPSSFQQNQLPVDDRRTTSKRRCGDMQIHVHQLSVYPRCISIDYPCIPLHGVYHCFQVEAAQVQSRKIIVHITGGAGRSSEVERSLMVRWVVGSILHGVDPLSYFSFQPVLHDWCNKGRGMCYPVCGMVHIKEPLLLIDKSSLCGGSGFPFSLSEWSLTICLTPCNRR